MLPFQITNLRHKLKLSQPRFAEMLGVPVGTVMNWEQARREPHESALMLLRVAARNPDALRQAKEPLPAEPAHPEFFTSDDRAILACQKGKRLAHELHELSDRQRNLLDALTDEIVALSQAFDVPELHQVVERIKRLHELRNCSEYGSFMLQIGRAVEAAWERRPDRDRYEGPADDLGQALNAAAAYKYRS